jgi:hypothetical protein
MIWFMIDVSNWLILADGVYTPNQKLKHMFQKLWKTRFVLSTFYDRVIEVIFMGFVKQQTSLGGHHHFLLWKSMVFCWLHDLKMVDVNVDVHKSWGQKTGLFIHDNE